MSGPNLRSGRKRAEWRMTSTCRVTRKSASSNQRDPGSGVSSPADPDVIYEGRCRVRVANAAAAIMQVGQAALAMQQAPLSVPVSVTLQKGDVVTITASEDASQVGMVRTIKAEHTGDQLTAHRYQFEEVH